MLVNGESKYGDDEDYFDLTEDDNEIIIKWYMKKDNCNYLFRNLSHITKIDFSNFDSSEVTSMVDMFSNCYSLTSIDFTNFNTSLVKDMTGMFYNCNSLISINLGNFNTRSLLTMNYMFYLCESLESLDLSSFDTSLVTNMARLFQKCEKLTTLIINNFKTDLVEDMYFMFSGCTLLTTLNIDNFITTSVINMEGMFYDCNNLLSLNLGNFDTSSVTRMKGMFYNCYLLTSLNINNFNTILVKDFSMMFTNCNELTSLNLNSFNTSSATNMENLFFNCTRLKTLDLRKFNTSSVTKMNSMFGMCGRIQKILFGTFFKTSHVENMEGMFYYCINLRSLDLSNFDTTSVITMNSMFRRCRSLTSLNLNSFYTPFLQNMNYMFNYCDNLEFLEIDNFNTELVTNMKGLFDTCPKLTSLNLYNFYTLNLNTQYSSIFNSTNVYSGLIYCINKDITLSNIQNLLSPFINNCSYFCFKQSKKFILETEECVDNCTNHPPYIYEYKSICYESCPDDTYYNYEKTGCIEKIPDGYYLYDESQKTIDKCINNCSNCTVIDFCISCNNEDGFYQLFNDSQNVGSFIKCYKEIPEGHFLDSNEKIIKQCYPACKECEELGNDINNKCTECYSDKILNEGNCYEGCEYYFYYDSLNSIQCTTEGKCPNLYNLLIEEKKQCIDSCEKSDFKYEFNGTCYKNCPNRTHSTSNNNYLCEEDLICDIYYNYTQTGCIDIIPEGFYLNDTYHKTIDKCDIKCKNCSRESVINNLCITCNNYENYYPKFDDNNLFINCYNGNQDGYYFDNNEQIYMPCYSTCKRCNEFGNITDNKCTECYPNFIKINNNCYNKCNFYYFFDSSDEYQCSPNNFCPDDYSKLIKEKKQCIGECNKDNIYKYEYNKICYIKCPEETKISNNYTCIEKIQCNDNYPYLIIEIGECSKNCSGVNFFNSICTINSDDSKVKDTMINIIREDILNGNLHELINSEVNELNQDLIVSNKKMLYQITSSHNQNNNKNMNISTIKLGECENILKKHYNLNDDDELIIFKIEIYQEGFLIPIIEYEVYSLKIKEKLDLNLCNKTKINILHSVNIDEKYLFKYNSTDDYYTDKCYPFTTENNTDITLDDRKNEFINNNMSLCEANCEYKGYDLNTKQAECDCEIKTSISLKDELEIDKDLFLNNFKDIQKSMNLFVLKCYYIFFTYDGFIYNIGSYILLIIILLEIFCLIYFLLKGYKVLLDRFHHYYFIIYKNKNINNEKNAKNENVKNSENENFNLRKEGKKPHQIINVHIDINKGNIYNESIQNCNSNDLLTNKTKEKTELISNPKKKKKKKIVKKIKKLKFKIPESESRDFKSRNFLSSKNVIKDNKINDIDIHINHTDNISINDNEIYNDYELNNLEYEQALKYDKRSYCQYYIAQLKYKQLLIFVFFTSSDYNSRILKISLFLFSFALFLSVNALFFTDDTMHKIYVDEGSFNFIYHIPQILYSSVISSVIRFIINFLSLTEKNILKLREEKENKKERFGKILKCLKIKFILLFILEFLFLICFWYYLGCFCAVYRNTQSHLLKDTLTSFGTSLIYPFGICLLPGALRIPALLEKDKKCLYKISQIVQLI